MQFSENSRVWIYQSTRQLTNAETEEAQQALNAFTANWTAHNNALKAKAEVRYNRFFVLIVDESQAGASGCSIDKSVHFMQNMEQRLGIKLFDRFNLAYREDAEVRSAPRADFEKLIKSGKINSETIVFNNLVQNLNQLESKWEVPLKDSWHQQLFGGMLVW